MHVLQAETKADVGVLTLRVSGVGGAAMHGRAENNGTSHAGAVFRLQVNGIANANVGFVQGNMLRARDQTSWIDIFHNFFPYRVASLHRVFIEI